MAVKNTEEQVLKSTLDRALDEAVTKTGRAVAALANRPEDYEKNLWAAAEASEYASLVYSLAYDMEIANAPISRREKHMESPLEFVKSTEDSLRRVSALRHEGESSSILEGYRVLRQVADSLRSSYLSMTTAKARGLGLS